MFILSAKQNYCQIGKVTEKDSFGAEFLYSDTKRFKNQEGL